MKSTPRDLYRDLDLTPTADAAAIKAAYKRLGCLHHPDKHPTDAEAAAARFRAVAEAYHVLGDPQRRAEYDAARRAGPRALRSFWSRLPDAFAFVVPSFGDFREACTQKDWHRAATSGVDTAVTLAQLFTTINTLRKAAKGST